MKIVVQKRNSGANVAPFSNVDTVDTEVETLRSESDLIKRIYRENGSGRYVLLVNPGSTYRSVWKGYVRRRGDSLIFHADQRNHLHTYTDLLRQTTPDSRPREVTAPSRDPDKGVAQ